MRKITGRIPNHIYCFCIIHRVQNDRFQLREFDCILISKLFVNDKYIIIDVLQVVISLNNELLSALLGWQVLIPLM
jgi:hypothetical protein